jgi:hypothetical protein
MFALQVALAAIRDGGWVEPVGQNVQQEAPDELVWDERHRAKPRLAVAVVILVAEGDTALVEADRPAV